MPVAANPLIGHTWSMSGLIRRPRQASRRLSRRPWGITGIGIGPTTLALCGLLMLSSAGHAREQLEIKAAATKQIQAAAAKLYSTEPQNIEVRLADRRLILPDCATDFDVSFPFSDRVTTQIDCKSPSWRGFVQIRILNGINVFRYNSALPKGEVLLRSHVSRQTVSAETASTNRVRVLEDFLGLKLVSSVRSGEILVESQFDLQATPSLNPPNTSGTGAWISRQIIPRGNRLRKETFSWVIIEGRVPTDVIPLEADFPMFEALRDIMPGDQLRRSVIKMAPAVKKNEEIEISLIRGALTVTNVVRVSRDATIGESITVTNVESGISLRARVTGIGELELL